MRRFASLALLLLVACTSDGGPPGQTLGGADGLVDDGQPLLHPDVVLIEESDCFVGVEITAEDRSVLTFDLSCAPADAGIIPGAIVVGVVDGGYLRRVEQVDHTPGGPTVVRTSGASMAEAVSNASFAEQLSMTDGERFSLDLGNTQLYGDSIGDGPVYIHIPNGSLTVNPELTIDAEFGWFSLEEATMRLDTTYLLDVTINGRSTNGLHLHKDKTIATFTKPFAFAAGPLPVAGVWENKVKLGFWVQAPGGFEVEVGGTADGVITIGGVYDEDDGWSTVNDASFEADAHPPSFDVHTDLTIRPYVRVESFVKFYGLAGPLFRADGYVEAEARAGCPGIDWDVSAGIETKAMLRLQITDNFKPSKHIPIKTWEWLLREGFLPWPFEVPELLCGDTDLECGDSVEYDTGWPGSSSWNSTYPSCDGATWSGPEVAHRLTIPSGQHVDVTATLDSGAADQRVFLMENVGYPGGGPFGAQACVEGGGTSAGTEAWGGEVWWVVVDGGGEEPGSYRVSVDCDVIEDPDPDPDPDPIPGGGPPGSCTPEGTISCGQEVSGDTSQSSDGMSYYPCNVGNYTGPEQVWQWTATVSGPVEWKLVSPRPTQVDHDVIVLDGSGGCASEKCEAWGGNGTEFEAVAGTTYMLVVDGYNGAAGPYTATLDCSP